MACLRKDLSAPGLLAAIRRTFADIPDPRSGATTISLVDALMSGLAVFSLKSPSLLQFDQQRHDPVVAHNLCTLYGVEQTPCDTQLRAILDPVDPQQLRPAFKAALARAQRGKGLEDFVFFQGHYLMAVDGTGQFASSAVCCPQCCVKVGRDGEERYYHQLLGAVLVHPEHSAVLPLCPEPILRGDGQTKNDCELSAAKRLLVGVRHDHPHLPLIVVEDALFANGPHVKLLQDLHMQFILGVKPGSHYALFEEAQRAFERGQGHTLEQVDPHDERITHCFRWVHDLPLNDTHPEIRVHFLDYEEVGPRHTRHFTWITDLPLDPDTVWLIMKGGRARWRVENETFNTLKHQGYHLEHNYGHGKQYLASTFAFLMMLAFLVDQLQKHCCPLFQQALQKQGSMRVLWEAMRALFHWFCIDTWATFFQILIHGLGLPTPAPDTS